MVDDPLNVPGADLDRTWSAPRSGAHTLLDETQRPELTIVVPAYNESARLPGTLRAIDQFIIDSRLTVELLVVDDGSSDDTIHVAKAHTSAAARYVTMCLSHRGKASAVRTGILASNGRHVLFTDADLSTPIDYATQLMEALEHGADVAIGSREGIGSTRVGEPAYRHVMGRVFNAVVRLLAVPGINDTQCGFKAFRRDAARDIFSRTILHSGDAPVHGPRVTGFDVEVLFIARKSGYTIAEVPVYWEHVSGSKVQPLPDSFRMFADVLRVRWNALRGHYR